MSNKASKRKAKQMGGLSELQHAMTHKATQKKNTHTYDKLPSKGGKAKQPNQPSKHASVHVVTHRERERAKKKERKEKLQSLKAVKGSRQRKPLHQCHCNGPLSGVPQKATANKKEIRHKHTSTTSRAAHGLALKQKNKKKRIPETENHSNQKPFLDPLQPASWPKQRQKQMR